jgi:hypothetical protein
MKTFDNAFLFYVFSAHGLWPAVLSQPPIVPSRPLADRFVTAFGRLFQIAEFGRLFRHSLRRLFRHDATAFGRLVQVQKLSQVINQPPPPLPSGAEARGVIVTRYFVWRHGGAKF